MLVTLIIPMIEQSPVLRLAILHHLDLEHLDRMCLTLAPRVLQAPQLLLEVVERRLLVLLSLGPTAAASGLAHWHTQKTLLFLLLFVDHFLACLEVRGDEFRILLKVLLQRAKLW